jgi:hypothetical protein
MIAAMRRRMYGRSASAQVALRLRDSWTPPEPSGPTVARLRLTIVDSLSCRAWTHPGTQECARPAGRSALRPCGATPPRPRAPVLPKPLATLVAHRNERIRPRGERFRIIEGRRRAGAGWCPRTMVPWEAHRPPRSGKSSQAFPHTPAARESPNLLLGSEVVAPRAESLPSSGC